MEHIAMTSILNARLAKFVEFLNESVMKQQILPVPVELEVLSDKWARINKLEGYGRSAYCFVALKDFETKMLGKVTAGDIHMAASWKAPAKHSRGNLLDEATWSCCGPYGVALLR